MRTGLIVALAAMCLTPALAQLGEAPEERLDIKKVREQRKRVEGGGIADDSVRGRILEHYDKAISALESEQAAKRSLARLEQERAQVDSTFKNLRSELNKSQPTPVLDLPDNPTFEYVEVELARARVRLDGTRTALRAAEQEKVEREKRRNDISKRLGRLDQEMETVTEQLRSPRAEMVPEMGDAVTASLRAARQFAEQEIQTLRAELVLLDKRSALIPLRVDLAQRRVSYDERTVALLEAAAADGRAREAASSLDRVTRLSQETSKALPPLEGTAGETVQLARQLWAEDGVLNQTAVVATQLTNARKDQADLDRIAELIWRQFDAKGYRSGAPQVWPKVPDSFPHTSDVLVEFSDVQRKIPEVQQELIRLEESRAGSSDLRLKVQQAIRSAAGTISPETERLAESLLSTRQDVLDQLIQAYGRYSNQLIELESLLGAFTEKLQQSEASFYERILWLPSAPGPMLPRLTTLAEAVTWYLSGANWNGLSRVIGRGFVTVPGRLLVLIVVVVLLLWFRRRMIRRLDWLAEKAKDPSSESLRWTLEAVALTGGLAAPLPTALYTLSKLLGAGDVSSFLSSAGRAFGYLASIMGVLELLRQMFRPKGLAEAQFGWDARLAMAVSRGLHLSELFFVLPLFISLHCAFVGMRLSSVADLQRFNNSLGRICFIIAMAAFALPLLKVFRPGMRMQDRGPFQHRQPVGIYAYAFIVFGIFLPAALALAGYYVTGFTLALQVLRMLWLMVCVALLAGVLGQWHITRTRRAVAMPEMGASKKMELMEANAQTAHLLRFVVTVVIAVGLYGIWSQALPALQVMKRIQIWPEFKITGEEEPGTPVVAKAAGEAAPAEKPVASAGQDKASAPPVPLPGVTGTAPPDAGQPQDTSGLTFWAIIQALLSAAITWALVRHIPGVLTLTLRTRTKFDSGARVAFATLVRYVILILGVSATLGVLGVTWSKIQWLAAALTFGLGFGLQEVVANFVSGLILLVERPLRVGDAVTVGDLQGRVTRIQMRATTIALWDGSEMIVPNKEFITTKLVNWTLSDTKRRVDIPLRVAYGADIAKVKELLLDAVRRNPLVLKDPEPMALLEEFATDALRFELRFFVHFDSTVQAKQEVTNAIDQAFRQESIHFALPRLDIQVADGELQALASPETGAGPQVASKKQATA